MKLGIGYIYAYTIIEETFALRHNIKLFPCFYGLFQVLKKIDNVTYQVDLPIASKIDHVFHDSALEEVGR